PSDLEIVTDHSVPCDGSPNRTVAIVGRASALPSRRSHRLRAYSCPVPRQPSEPAVDFEWPNRREGGPGVLEARVRSRTQVQPTVKGERAGPAATEPETEVEPPFAPEEAPPASPSPATRPSPAQPSAGARILT